jgi:hypothetical protein
MHAGSGQGDPWLHDPNGNVPAAALKLGQTHHAINRLSTIPIDQYV